MRETRGTAAVSCLVVVSLRGQSVPLWVHTHGAALTLVLLYQKLGHWGPFQVCVRCVYTNESSVSPKIMASLQQPLWFYLPSPLWTFQEDHGKKDSKRKI